MRILRHYTNVEAAARGAAIAIGNFDGMHRGHAAVISEAGRFAHDAGAPWAVLTFEPHPRRFFQPAIAPFRLTPFRVKARRLADLGVDYMVNLRFDSRIAGMEAEDFVHDVLVAGLGVRHVVVGPGFKFGKGRRGNDALMLRMAAAHGFGFTEVPAVRHGDAMCASTDIRDLIRRGHVDEAAARLGAPWEIEARVRPGAARGEAMGFPTANMAINRVLHPGPGIYAVRVGVTGQGETVWHDGAAYIGARPTFAGDELLLEAHLFDFSGELYGQRLRVAFVERVRPDQAFDGPESLIAQMTDDCRRARQILDAAGPILNSPAAVT